MAAALAGLAAPAAITSALADERTKGEFSPFASAAPGSPNHRLYGGIEGEAEMLRTDDGTTEVVADVEGLAPGREYPVHVHEAPCGRNAAAGHYKHNPAGPPVSPNEIWPGPVTADDDGTGYGETVAPYVARWEAQSVVVHAPNGDKLACADLDGGGNAGASAGPPEAEYWRGDDGAGETVGGEVMTVEAPAVVVVDSEPAGDEAMEVVVVEEAAPDPGSEAAGD